MNESGFFVIIVGRLEGDPCPTLHLAPWQVEAALRMSQVPAASVPVIVGAKGVTINEASG